MKIKNDASGGNSGSGMEENPKILAPPRGRRRSPVSRADRPVLVKPQRPRLDQPSPGLLSRLADDGDGMDQARPHCALTHHLRKARKMHTEPSGNQSGNTVPPIPESAEIAYNLSEGERPDGLKVRFKIKIATGAEARELDARQAEAIRRLLQWAQQNQHFPGRT
jgi:hypothetical protein